MMGGSHSQMSSGATASDPATGASTHFVTHRGGSQLSHWPQEREEGRVGGREGREGEGRGGREGGEGRGAEGGEYNNIIDGGGGEGREGGEYNNGPSM